MEIIVTGIVILVVFWLVESMVANKGLTFNDYYNQKLHGIKPDSSNDEEESFVSKEKEAAIFDNSPVFSSRGVGEPQFVEEDESDETYYHLREKINDFDIEEELEVEDNSDFNDF